MRACWVARWRSCSLHRSFHTGPSDVRPTNPRSTLLQQTPRERADEKTRLVCSWLAIFGHSTESVIRDMLAIKARGICARLARHGLLMPVAVALSNVRTWALTPEGLRIAELALGRRVTYVSHPERLTLSRLTHELLLQREVVARLTTDMRSLQRFRADRELRHLRSAVRPDLLVRDVQPDDSERTVCIELEVTSKGSNELGAKMRAMIAIMNSRTEWFWYVSEGQAACDRYRRCWEEAVSEHGYGVGMTHAELLRACTFEVAEATRA